VLADWWQEFSQASDAVREDLVEQLRDEQSKHGRRVRTVRPAPAESQQPPSQSQPPSRDGDDESSESDDAGAGGGADAPRKRRRRRRKPAGQGGRAPSGPDAGSSGGA
jgi:poly(A) polymerase